MHQQALTCEGTTEVEYPASTVQPALTEMLAREEVYKGTAAGSPTDPSHGDKASRQAGSTPLRTVYGVACGHLIQSAAQLRRRAPVCSLRAEHIQSHNVHACAEQVLSPEKMIGLCEECWQHGYFSLNA